MTLNGLYHALRAHGRRLERLRDFGVLSERQFKADFAWTSTAILAVLARTVCR